MTQSVAPMDPAPSILELDIVQAELRELWELLELLELLLLPEELPMLQVNLDTDHPAMARHQAMVKPDIPQPLLPNINQSHTPTPLTPLEAQEDTPQEQDMHLAHKWLVDIKLVPIQQEPTQLEPTQLDPIQLEPTQLENKLLTLLLTQVKTSSRDKVESSMFHLRRKLSNTLINLESRESLKPELSLNTERKSNTMKYLEK